ncbi:MAG: SDR family NAD(P)-dependent oxidoreductase [Pseudomonadota bacterium]
MALNLDAIGKKIGPLTSEYTWKDVVLYALGIGAGFDELEYVYESKLKTIPSFAVTTIYGAFSEAAIAANVNLAGILHGEQDTVFHNPIPTEGKISTSMTLTNMYDKGKDRGAIVVAEADTYHENGQKLYTNYVKLFCRLDGGFGGDSGPEETVQIPERAPDFEEKSQPALDQPLIYRLSGDYFALHIDPGFAKAAGFEFPIMHGLCTHGYACRAVIKNLFPGEPERMTRFRVRFSRPLYPGKPITTQIWKIDENKAYFKVINTETQELVIDKGIVEWMSQADLERRQRLGGINFDGQVAVVTGAGAGLGRAYALELAKKGAKVVVNDLGGARDGSGGSTSAADKVVEEIKALGGEAVANYDSVSTADGGKNIIETAIKAFGRIDIVINNAGILRDKTLVKMDPENWDAIMDVHLKGAYNVTRPAFVKMREQGYGRIIFTTSAAGLYGNFGQTNYSAAKMALLGLMNTLKEEGGKYNIKVNTIAPVAATRLTEDILPPDMMEKMKPEFVAPLVLYLCSEQCPVTGKIYNAGMGYFNRAAIVTGPGAVVGDGKTPPSVEEVAAAMDKIKSLKGGLELPNATAAFTPMIEAFSPKAPAAAAPSAGGGVSPADIIASLPGKFLPDAAAGVNVVFQYDITGEGGGAWHQVISDGKLETGEGRHANPTTTITVGASDFVAMMTGKAKAMSLFTSGKLKIGGDVMKSQLLEKLFKL